MKRISLITALIILLLSLIVSYFYFFSYNKEHPDFEELKPEFTLDATKFYEEFIYEPEISQLKYGGKMVQLSGKVGRVEKSESQTIVVFAFNKGPFGDEGIRCIMLDNLKDEINSDVDIEGKLVKGICSGFNDTDVILEKCTLVF